MHTKENPALETRGPKNSTPFNFGAGGTKWQHITGQPFIDLWRLLGGGEIRGKRTQAFWASGDGWSVSHDIDRGLWCHHATGAGGDAADLVRVVLGCSTSQALTWLEAHGFRSQRKPLNRLELQRRRAVLETEQARRESAALFAVALENELDRAKLAACAADDDKALERAARLQWHLGRWPMVVFDLAEAINPIETQRHIEAGRANRQHAAALTAAAVQLIASAA